MTAASLPRLLEQEFAPVLRLQHQPECGVVHDAGVLVGFSKNACAAHSWPRPSPKENILTEFRQTFTDGTAASGPTVERPYAQSGEDSEILKITDARGEVDYDFAVVLVSQGC